MIRLFRHYFPRSLLILGLIETVLVFLSALFAWQLRVSQIGGAEPLTSQLPELLTYTATVYVMLLGVGAYQLSSFRTLRMTSARIMLALVLTVLILSVIMLIFPTLNLWRSVLFYAILMTLFALVATRAVFQWVIGWRSFREPIVIIGAGSRGARLRELENRDTSGFRVVEQFALGTGQRIVSDAKMLSDLESLSDFCLRNDVEEIVLALDERRGALPARQLLEAKLSGVRVSEKTSFLERMSGRVDLASVSASWLIFSDGFLGSSGWSVASKRIFDIVSSMVLLLLTSPILVLAAIAVKTTSAGPVFYRQERVGQFGRTFSIAKFRSMVQDAERDGAKWAAAGDPRVTPVGRLLRKTRIDEIPQIFNVLKGDMSFVGPRPERPVFVKELAEQIPFYNERHIVKPGITGWAQLNYPYGASMEDAGHKLEYDLYYIKNYSLFIDLVILIQTMRVVIWQDGVR